MSTNKKALFFDIDGTILSEITGKIPESASAALKKAHDLGHLLFINTGRTICCLPPMICQLPFSGYLCGCGSYIVYNDEVLTSTQIPKERQAEIMELQQDIAFDKDESMIGRSLLAMIEGKVADENAYVARTYRDAPNVDGYLFINTSRELMTGDFVQARVTGAYEYDLIGELEDEFTK